MSFDPGGFHMGPLADPAVYGSGAAFTGREFGLSEISEVMFAVEGLTDGTVTIKAKFHDDSDWQTLDAVELVFAADAVKTALIGGCLVRAEGSAAADGLNDGGVFIFGRNLFINES